MKLSEYLYDIFLKDIVDAENIIKNYLVRSGKEHHYSIPGYYLCKVELYTTRDYSMKSCELGLMWSFHELCHPPGDLNTSSKCEPKGPRDLIQVIT